MFSRKYIRITSIGTVELQSSSANNFFSIVWEEKVIHAHFDNGEWQIEMRGPGYVKLEVAPILHVEVVNAILQDEDARTSLEKWRKAALKRLEKSVPRLKKEYEAAQLRMEALREVNFK